MPSTDALKLSDSEFDEVALYYLLVLLLTLIISCSVLIFQCRKLQGLLTNKLHNPATLSDRPTPRLDDNVKRMKGLKSQLRSSVQKTHAELAEELRAVTQIQAELASQLRVLQMILETQTANNISFHTDDSKED